MAATIVSSLPVALLLRCMVAVNVSFPARRINGNFPDPEKSRLMVMGAR